MNKSVRYNLLLSNNLDAKPIRLTFVIYTGERLVWRTGMYCPVKHWDTKTQRVADQYLDIDDSYFDTNESLDRISAFVLSTYRSYRKNKQLYQLSKDRFRELLNEFVDSDRSAVSNDAEILQFYEKYVYDRSKQIDLAENTRRHDQAFLNKFKSFHDTLPIPLSFQDVGIGIFEMYRNYLWRNKNLQDSTIYKHISKFRDVLIRAQIENRTSFNVSAISLGKHLNLSRKAKETIALTTAQIDKLMRLELPKNNGLSDVRYLFICACYTGLRFNRWSEIKRENLFYVNGKQFLELFTVKGSSKRVVVPVHPRLAEIATKYDWLLPTSYTMQFVNRSLDVICKEAGFTNVVRRAVRSGGKDRIESLPFHKLVRTHTARRTFVTLALQSGMSFEDVQSITTHSTKEMVEHYDKEAPIDKAKRLVNHPFFANSI